ncbi:MAG TPA: leucyl/phenylalanyl-tRNA--protein transferase [Thiotrichales bacterium]|nr:leucyl/phenylalanyl-tRNA--protein transferase [Thiotrichales bacterium]
MLPEGLPEWFPPVSSALEEPNGLLAVGGDLSPRRVLAAYRRGIFPWYSQGQPILWWSPDPRAVLFPERLHISRSLRKRLRRRSYRVTLDLAFEAVIEACAAVPRPGQEGTWITSEMAEAYLRLHRLGYAHSVETWQAGRLVGGLYGVAMGRIFFGESMFSRETDASKVAFAHLVRHLRRYDYRLIDCQVETSHLLSLGAGNIPRDRFVAMVDELVGEEAPPGPGFTPETEMEEAW